MKILVTGVAGFIGSSLAEQLLSDPQNEVIGVDAVTDYYSSNLKRKNLLRLASRRFVFIEGDLLTLELEGILRQVDVVFHQAGEPGVRSSWGQSFIRYAANNVMATQRLLEAAKSAPRLSRFVYASSSSVYGEATEFPTTELTATMPLSPYGVTKLAAEHLVSLYAVNYGIPTVSLRYFTVYGPRQRPDMAFTRFINAGLRDAEIQVFGTGEQIREFTYVTDIVAANVLAAKCDLAPGEVINLSGGSSVSVNEVIRELELSMGHDLRVSRASHVHGDVRRTGGSTEKAKRLLGWSPDVTLEEGLACQISWAKEEAAFTGGLNQKAAS